MLYIQIQIIQNELIECINEHIKERILEDIKSAEFFTILCDEVVDVASKNKI